MNINYTEVVALFETVEKCNAHGDKYSAIRDAASKQLGDIVKSLTEPKPEAKPEKVPLSPANPETEVRRL